jgi:hypothetical protein
MVTVGRVRDEPLGSALGSEVESLILAQLHWPHSVISGQSNPEPLDFGLLCASV